MINNMKSDKDFDILYTEMDKECVTLCKAINSLEGIQTIESCCGHRKGSYHIYAITESIGYLPDLLYHLDNCHNGFFGWVVELSTDCGRKYPTLTIKKDKEAPGDAYKEAEAIAKNILNDETKRGKVCRR